MLKFNQQQKDKVLPDLLLFF